MVNVSSEIFGKLFEPTYIYRRFGFSAPPAGWGRGGYAIYRNLDTGEGYYLFAKVSFYEKITPFRGGFSGGYPQTLNI